MACAVNSPRGDIGRMDNESIAIECDWPADQDPDVLIDALEDTGWLDEHPEHRLVIHDWNDHAPRWVRGVAAKKGGIIQSISYEPTGSSTKSGTRSSTRSATRSTTPNTTQQEHNTTKHMNPSDSCVETQSVSTPPPVVVFEVKGKTKEWGVTQEKLSEWRDAFPDADIVRELKKAKQWLADNPQRKKTARGMPAFIFRWLERATNSGRIAVDSDESRAKAEYARRLQETKERREAAEQSRKEAASVRRETQGKESIVLTPVFKSILEVE